MVEPQLREAPVRCQGVEQLLDLTYREVARFGLPPRARQVSAFEVTDGIAFDDLQYANPVHEQRRCRRETELLIAEPPRPECSSVRIIRRMFADGAGATAAPRSWWRR